MATKYEIWKNNVEYNEVWHEGFEYIEAWTLINGEKNLVWKKGKTSVYGDYYFVTENGVIASVNKELTSYHVYYLYNIAPSIFRKGYTIKLIDRFKDKWIFVGYGNKYYESSDLVTFTEITEDFSSSSYSVSNPYVYDKTNNRYFAGYQYSNHQGTYFDFDEKEGNMHKDIVDMSANPPLSVVYTDSTVWTTHVSPRTREYVDRFVSLSYRTWYEYVTIEVGGKEKIFLFPYWQEYWKYIDADDNVIWYDEPIHDEYHIDYLRLLSYFCDNGIVTPIVSVVKAKFSVDNPTPTRYCYLKVGHSPDSPDFREYLIGSASERDRNGRQLNKVTSVIHLTNNNLDKFIAYSEAGNYIIINNGVVTRYDTIPNFKYKIIGTDAIKTVSATFLFNSNQPNTIPIYIEKERRSSKYPRVRLSTGDDVIIILDDVDPEKVYKAIKLN